MVPKHNGSAVLVGVSVLSLFLALSVFYVVDNIARPSEDIEHRNNSDESDNGLSREYKIVNPLTEALYHQLFQNKPLEVCPVYFKNICRWNIHKDENETKENESYTTTQELKQYHVIIRSCQVFGIVKYQDVCFYVGNSLLEDIADGRRVAKILKDCAYVNDNGYPCVFEGNLKSENQAPRNVCISDGKTVINVLTQRCRVREKVYFNCSDFITLEDIIYEQQNDRDNKEEGSKKDESSANSATGDNNEQYKSGSNKTKTGTNATTVVCHILLAALLVVSASVALFEVCRDRLSDKKLGQQSIIGDGRINAIGSRSYSLDSRRSSSVDPAGSRRHVRRESSTQQQAMLQEASDSGTNSSVASRQLLGARPPPLLRRSSFPVHIGAAAAAASITHHSFTTKEHTPNSSRSATPTKSMSRRTSMDGSEGNSSPDMAKRRVRFLRRH